MAKVKKTIKWEGGTKGGRLAVREAGWHQERQTSCLGERWKEVRETS
jgi:hypothetical protein